MRWRFRTPRRAELAELRAEVRAQGSALRALEALAYPAWLARAVAGAAPAGWSVEAVADGLRFCAPGHESYTVSRNAIDDPELAAAACGELSIRLAIPVSPESAPGTDRYGGAPAPYALRSSRFS
jgi:hypothetical protein